MGSNSAWPRSANCAPGLAPDPIGAPTATFTPASHSAFSARRREAVWQAAQEGLAVLGINDHYTIAGHEEFRRACEIAGIAAAFSLEAVALDRDAQAQGMLLNDPENPGRAYLCGKGVTSILPHSSPEMHNLAGMRMALERRNRRDRRPRSLRSSRIV